MEDDLRELLHDFMLSHCDWMLKVAKPMLEQLDTSLEDYINTVTTPVLVLARIFKIHIAIFMRKGVWCTSRDRSLKKCWLGLIYHGGGTFSETVKIGECENYAAFLKKCCNSGDLLSHLRKTMPGIPPKFLPRQPAESDNETEAQPEMDIPSILNDMDRKCDIAQDLSQKIAHGVKQANSCEADAMNSSDSEESVVMGDYIPPPTKQYASGSQVCPVCASLEPSQAKLIAHIAMYHPSYAFPCTFCNKTFLSHNSRYKHETDHTPPTFFCGICAKGHHTNTELNKHMLRHSDTRPFTCQKCPKGYYDEKSLNCHMELHNTTMYQCPTCGKQYESKDRLYIHKRGQHGKGYPAPCGQYFKWPGRRQRHILKGQCTFCKNYNDTKKATKASLLKPFKKEQDGVKKEPK